VIRSPAPWPLANPPDLPSPFALAQEQPARVSVLTPRPGHSFRSILLFTTETQKHGERPIFSFLCVCGEAFFAVSSSFASECYKLACFKKKAANNVLA
jgi:hypothetical protein